MRDACWRLAREIPPPLPAFRVHKEGMSQIHRFGECELDEGRYQLRNAGVPVELEPKVFEVLAYLVRERDRVVSKRELLDELWPDRIVGEWSLTRCISLARKAVQDNPSRQSVIQTVYGRGYRLVADVVSGSEEAAPLDVASTEEARAEGGFVGRSAELGELGSALASMLTGRGRVVLVSGESGIGKTRLIEEFASRARERGAMVRVGRGWEAGGAPAFWPWIQVVREEVRSRDASRLGLLLGSGGGEIARVVPELSDVIPDVPEPLPVEAGQERFRVFDAISSFLKRVAQERPLVVLLDALHRTDAASLRLLEFLGREIANLPILVVGTYRELELQQDSERRRILADISRATPVHHIALAGLSESEVGRFIEGRTSSPPDASLVAAVHDHTAGNPFLLTQVLSGVSASDLLAWSPDDGTELPLPVGVRQAILGQLGAVSETHGDFLADAAVIGGRFSIEILAVASGIDADKLREQAAELEQAGILARDSGQGSDFRFVHGLVRDTLYAELDPQDREQRHQRIAETLERFRGRQPEYQAELAYHFGAAGSTGSTKQAFEYAVAAGRWAVERLAYEDACRQYARALELSGLLEEFDEANRCDLLLDLGEAQIQTRAPETQSTLERASRLARRLEDPERLARAALASAQFQLSAIQGTTDDRMISILEEALEALGQTDSKLRARTLAALASALHYSAVPRRVARLREEALEMARRLEDPPTLLFVMSSAIFTLWGPDLVEERLQLVGEAVAVGQRVGVKEENLDARIHRMVCWAEMGQFDRFDEELTQISSMPSNAGSQASEFIPFFRAGRALMTGRFEVGENFVNEFLARVERRQDDTGFMAFGLLVAMLRNLKGEAEEFVELSRSLAERHPGFDLFRAMLVKGYCDLDQPGLARGELERLASSDFAGIRHISGWIGAISHLGEACSRLGDLPRCESLYEKLVPYSLRHCATGIVYAGSVSRYLGVIATALSRWDAASRHFSMALEIETKAGVRPWIGWTRFDHARMLLLRGRSGDRALAESNAAQALDTARALGMLSLQRRILALQ